LSNAALIRSLLSSFLYFPSRAIVETPAAAGLEFEDLWIDTEDGERIHGWWIPAPGPSLGQILVCHGNGGNVGDRVLQAKQLTEVGFDVLLFDYRGYGRSSGRPSEEGTYRDARAARAALLSQPGVDGRALYLGDSLGGGVALPLALDFPPRGLILQSSFTSIREMAREHYPFIPRALVPDAYPTLSRIPELRAPLLVLHGERDDLVPLPHGQALFEAAPEPKRMEVFAGRGHADLVELAGERCAEAIADWARELER
jgi:fermentation-respiration switch protein FrsA (DUF1100 family)